MFTLVAGSHLANSFYQFPKVLLGPKIRKGPLIFLFSLKKATKEIV